MEFEVKEVKKLEDGKYTGEITKLELRTEPHEYIDLTITIGKEINLKVSYPAFISRGSKLGTLLELFGQELKTGEKLDPEKILKGKIVDFMIMNKKGKDNRMYSNIIAESVKPHIVKIQ